MTWVSHDEYLAFLKTPEWQAQREDSFEHFGEFCQACGECDHLQIHHASYNDPLRQTRRVYRIPLCKPCHEAVTLYIQEHRGEATMYVLTWRWIFSQRKLSPGATR